MQQPATAGRRMSRRGKLT